MMQFLSLHCRIMLIHGVCIGALKGLAGLDDFVSLFNEWFLPAVRKL